MPRNTISLLEVLCVITVLIVLAFFLGLAPGPLISPRKHANLMQCGNQLSCIGKAMFQYESPTFFNKSPFPDDTPLARRDSNVMALMPIIALFRANLLDNTKIIFCPADEAVLPNDRLLTAPSPILPGIRPHNLTSYLFTLYYDKADRGDRVIAGDASGSVLPGRRGLLHLARGQRRVQLPERSEADRLEITPVSGLGQAEYGDLYAASSIVPASKYDRSFFCSANFFAVAFDCFSRSVATRSAAVPNSLVTADFISSKYSGAIQDTPSASSSAPCAFSIEIRCPLQPRGQW